MNKMITSMMVIGAGVAGYSLAQKNNLLSARTMKRIQKRVKRAIF